MSTVNERDVLRRALRAADAIEPRADGLQRIQRRLLRPPSPLAVAWADTASTYVRMRVPAEMQRFLELLREGAGLVWERFGPSGGTRGRGASRANGWLRPVAVLGVTIFVVAVGTYVAIDGQQVFSPSASNSIHSVGGGTGGTHGGGGIGSPYGSASNPIASASPSPSPSCKTKRVGAGPAPTPTGTASSSPAASPSSTPSPSPTPSVGGSSSPPASPTIAPNGPVTTDVRATESASRPTILLVSLLVQARGSASPKPTPSCATKKPRGGTAAPATHPSTAVISYAKLDDGR